jgi:hypothetical protein
MHKHTLNNIQEHTGPHAQDESKYTKIGLTTSLPTETLQSRRFLSRMYIFRRQWRRRNRMDVNFIADFETESDGNEVGIALIRCACLLPWWLQISSSHSIFFRVILSLCLILIYNIEYVQMMYPVLSVFVRFESVNHKVCAVGSVVSGRAFRAGQTEKVSDDKEYLGPPA